jgi:hypothetical protein
VPLMASCRIVDPGSLLTSDRYVICRNNRHALTHSKSDFVNVVGSWFIIGLSLVQMMVLLALDLDVNCADTTRIGFSTVV